MRPLQYVGLSGGDRPIWHSAANEVRGVAQKVMTRMQDRAWSTRKAVLRAGATVFERHGYAAATISQILEEAQVTKGAMYFHFDSKESLARAIVAEQSNWRTEHVDPSGCPFQRVIDLSYRFAHALVNDPLVRASIRLTLERATFSQAHDMPNPYDGWTVGLGEILGESAGCDELTIDPGVAANVIVSAITGVQLMSESRTGRIDILDRLRELWEVLAPAMVTEPTLKQLDLRGSTHGSWRRHITPP